ncbi:MAG: hypothetical protein AAFV80_01495 [Bacteroidota bacterium]
MIKKAKHELLDEEFLSLNPKEGVTHHLELNVSIPESNSDLETEYAYLLNADETFWWADTTDLEPKTEGRTRSILTGKTLSFSLGGLFLIWVLSNFSDLILVMVFAVVVWYGIVEADLRSKRDLKYQVVYLISNQRVRCVYPNQNLEAKVPWTNIRAIQLREVDQRPEVVLNLKQPNHFNWINLNSGLRSNQPIFQNMENLKGLHALLLDLHQQWKTNNKAAQ